MMKSTCFLISILVAMGAFGLHAIARNQNIEGSKLRANSWNYSEAQKQQMQTEAALRRDRAKLLGFTGLGFTFTSLAFLIAARLRCEPGFYSIPILLLLADVIVQMLL